MSALDSTEPLRAGGSPLRRWIGARIAALIPFGFRILRRWAPIPRLGGMYIATRHDDVREVFGTDAAFQVNYWEKLQVITGGEPFFLALADGEPYRSGVRAMQRVFHENDLPRLGTEAEMQVRAAIEAEAAEAQRAGRRAEIEVVSLIRSVTFDVIASYLGVPATERGSLAAWGTRLFEFQFADFGDNAGLRAEVDEIAPALRAHLDLEIARRKEARRTNGAGQGSSRNDDVVARCLERQAAGDPGYSDVEIRTSILCMIVGGPPQPPMVVPQALEQLLRRPPALKIAQQAARAEDDLLLHDCVIEAMRFDPLAPGLPRVAVRDWPLAKGTKREKMIPAGSAVLAAFASAMMDERRLPDPTIFRPGRLPHEYLHFGHGLHQCFGRHINHAMLHRMLKPLLQQRGLRRAAGRGGRLSKNGPFAERLAVTFDV